jgi:hypothetical protein
MHCLAANSAMLEEYFGGSRNMTNFIPIVKNLPPNATLYDYYSKAGFIVNETQPADMLEIIASMEQGYPVTILTLEGYTPNGGELFHNSTITRVQLLTRISEANIWVNDPVRGANYRWTQIDLFKVIYDRLTILGIK